MPGSLCRMRCGINKTEMTCASRKRTFTQSTCPIKSTHQSYLKWYTSLCSYICWQTIVQHIMSKLPFLQQPHLWPPQPTALTASTHHLQRPIRPGSLLQPLHTLFQLTTLQGFLLLIFQVSAEDPLPWAPRLRQMPLPDAASSESPQPSHPCTGKAALSVLPSRLAVSLRTQCSPLQALKTECWVQQGLDKHLTASREDRRTVQKHIPTHRHN